MYCTPVKTRKAQREHRCTNCGEMILKGEMYNVWESVEETWFKNKMHPECYESMCDEGEFEYMPFSGERPKRVAQ